MGVNIWNLTTEFLRNEKTRSTSFCEYINDKSLQGPKKQCPSHKQAVVTMAYEKKNTNLLQSANR